MQSALSLLAVTVTSMQPYALTDEELVHTLLQNSPDAMATVVGHTIGLSQEALNEMDYDQFFDLALETYKVNISFFSRSRNLAQRLVDASADARP